MPEAFIPEDLLNLKSTKVDDGSGYPEPLNHAEKPFSTQVIDNSIVDLSFVVKTNEDNMMVAQQASLVEAAIAVVDCCPTVVLPQWLKGASSAERSLMILKDLCQRKQQLLDMPKEQLRSGIFLATRDVLDEVIDEIWERVAPTNMSKETFSNMSEGAKIEFLRKVLPARVTEDMRELVRIRAEAEAVSSLDIGSESIDTRKALLKQLLSALELLKQLFYDIKYDFGNAHDNGGDHSAPLPIGSANNHLSNYYLHDNHSSNSVNGYNLFDSVSPNSGARSFISSPTENGTFNFFNSMGSAPNSQTNNGGVGAYGLFEGGSLSLAPPGSSNSLPGNNSWHNGFGTYSPGRRESHDSAMSATSNGSASGNLDAVLPSAFMGPSLNQHIQKSYSSPIGSPKSSLSPGVMAQPIMSAPVLLDRSEDAFHFSHMAEALLAESNDTFRVPGQPSALFGAHAMSSDVPSLAAVFSAPGSVPQRPLPTGQPEYEDECVALDAALSYLQRFLASTANVADMPGQWAEPPVRYKTAMCKRILDSSKCRYSRSCGFAHSEGEKDRFSRLHLATVKCQFGRKCRNPTCGRAHTPQAQQEAIRLYMGIVDRCRASKV